MQMPGRNWASDDYKYGFNGMENDNEIKGIGNSLDFGARMYDSRLGRWFATDPLEYKYPSISTYAFVGNMPIIAKDPNGKEILIVYRKKGEYKGQSKIRKLTYNKDGTLTDSDGDEYNGNDKFVEKVKKTLDNLKDLGGEIKDMVEDLQEDKNKAGVHSIADKFKTLNAGPGSKNRLSGKNSSETQFNPEYDRKKHKHLGFMTNERILGHELRHAWNKSKRRKLSKIKTKTHTSEEESDATRYDNKINEKQNKKNGTNHPARTKHGHKTLRPI